MCLEQAWDEHVMSSMVNLMGRPFKMVILLVQEEKGFPGGLYGSDESGPSKCDFSLTRFQKCHVSYFFVFLGYTISFQGFALAAGPFASSRLSWLLACWIKGRLDGLLACLVSLFVCLFLLRNLFADMYVGSLVWGC